MILLWSNLIFAQQSGVHLYNLRDWNTYKNCNYITSISEGPEYIYYGTSGGIMLFQKYGRYWDVPFTVSNGMSADFVVAVLYDNSTNFLWAAHSRGVSFLPPAENSWHNVSTSELQLAPDNSIIRLGNTADYIWLQTKNGNYIKIDKINGYYLGSQIITPLNVQWKPCIYDSLPPIVNYSFDKNFQFDPRGNIIDSQLRSFPIVLFYINYGTDVYGGSWGLGPFTGNTIIKNLRLQPTGPLQNSISALTKEGDALWMGSLSPLDSQLFNRSGVSVFNKNDKSWDYYESGFINELATNEINDLLWHNDRLWIATTQGLTILDIKRNKWKRVSMAQGLSDEIVTCIGSEDSVVWVGTPRGLNAISLPEMKIRRYRLDPSFLTLKINKIKGDRDKVWFATSNGLYAIDKSTRMTEHFDMFGKKIALNEAVAAEFGPIACNDSYAIFSRTNGLLSYNKNTKQWLEVPAINTLINRQINDLVLADNYLWIATSEGVVMMRLPDYYSEHYTTRDGLPDNNVTRIVLDDDLIWFGTAQGLTSFQWRKYVQPN